MIITTTHMKRSVSSTAYIELGYQMAKTACQSDTGLQRYKLLKSVMDYGRVGSCRVGPLMCEKNPVCSEDSLVTITVLSVSSSQGRQVVSSSAVYPVRGSLAAQFTRTGSLMLNIRV